MSRRDAYNHVIDDDAILALRKMPKGIGVAFGSLPISKEMVDDAVEDAKDITQEIQESQRQKNKK